MKLSNLWDKEDLKRWPRGVIEALNETDSTIIDGKGFDSSYSII